MIVHDRRTRIKGRLSSVFDGSIFTIGLLIPDLKQVCEGRGIRSERSCLLCHSLECALDHLGEMIRKQIALRSPRPQR
jgi:hypothetical protein